MKNKGLMEMTELLTSPHNYKEKVGIIVEKSKEIIKSDRACLWVKTSNGFRLDGGVPEGTHGIGVEITSESGAGFIFFDKLLKDNVPVLKNISDPDIGYMNEFAENLGITSIFALPLCHEKEMVGILVLDFVNNHNIQDDLLHYASFLAHIAATAIWKESARKKNKENESLVILAKNLAMIMHTLGNKHHQIGGFSEILIESISKEGCSCFWCCVFKKFFSWVPFKFPFRIIAKNDLNNIKIFAKEINDANKEVVEFIRGFKKLSQQREIRLEQIDINTFLTDISMDLADVLKFNGFHFDLDPDISDYKLFIDKFLLSDSLHDIVVNAIHARAQNITIKSKVFCCNNMIGIFISNDGDKIDNENIQKIFDPFTTKENGSGWGLVNAMSVAKMHGGRIEVESNKGNTEFKIYLPLSN